MSLDKLFGTDRAKEIKGVPVVVGLNDDSTEMTFYVTRLSTASNPAYAKAMEAAAKPFERAIALGTFSKEQDTKLTRDVFCKTILVGWQNVRDSAEHDVIYSPDAAAELLTRYPDLYTLLREEAASIANFRQAGLDAAAGN